MKLVCSCGEELSLMCEPEGAGTADPAVIAALERYGWALTDQPEVQRCSRCCRQDALDAFAMGLADTYVAMREELLALSPEDQIRGGATNFAMMERILRGETYPLGISAEEVRERARALIRQRGTEVVEWIAAVAEHYAQARAGRPGSDES